MSNQETRGQPLWVIIVLALLTSTVPSYMSFLASRQTIDEHGKDVGVASVDQTRAILEPAINDLNRRVGELSGRLEIIQANVGIGAVAAGPKAHAPSDAPPAAAAPSAENPSAATGAAEAPAPSARTLLRPSATLSSTTATALPRRPKLNPDQMRIRKELSDALSY